MDIATFSITKRITIWLFVVALLAGGILAYQTLSRYEDPEFTIKEALVMTPYLGATPQQVEEEVTDKISEAIQQLPQLKRTTSISRPGLSRVTVVIKDKYDKNKLPQVWDELRRKVNDIQKSLPPGAGPSTVVDDYGDVFGMLYAISGEGFSASELRDYARNIKKQLLLVDGVAKISLTGIEQEAIFIEIAQQKVANLGLSLDSIYQLLKSQNTVLGSGQVRVNDEYIEIRPTGNVAAMEDIGNLVIRSRASNSLMYLSDIATIKRGYVEVPEALNYFDGKPAVMMGLSVVSGGNVVAIGKAINARITLLEHNLPAGIVFNKVYDQPTIVEKSVQSFLINLFEAIAIVLVVLLLFMGARSAFIISFTLLLIVMGTLYFMQMFGISLERISLGALVIALGMLVDNAIVITDGILTRTQKGIKVLDAARTIVEQTKWPLLGATVVGILAFTPIGLSQDNTGEYAASLFYVICISLLLSWIIAITVVPLLCHYLFKPKAASKTQSKESRLVHFYREFLMLCLRKRYLTVITCGLLLAFSIFGFRFIPSGFFPDSTTPLFYIDYWRAEGSDIRALRDDMLTISEHILKQDEVENVTSVMGKGMPRFMLVYTPESENSSYGQLVVRVKDYRQVADLAPAFKQWILNKFPDSEVQIKRLRLGPGSSSKIEMRFSGPDIDVLRNIAEKAKTLMVKNPEAVDVRDDWRQKVKIIEPEYSEQEGRVTGITRKDMADSLQTAFGGRDVGTYREGDQLLPIISRSPDIERFSVNSMLDLSLWSDLLKRPVSISQLIEKVNVHWADNIVARRNRLRTITVKADPSQDIEASTLFNQLQSAIKTIPLPPGYKVEWGGEYENAKDAQAGLQKNIPMGLAMMIGIVVILFSAIKQPLAIWLCVPLSFIGVSFGLLITYKPFDFMALLGFLSLSGMLIKNAIVLIDQIDLEISEGKEPFSAIVDSAVSRLSPVGLAALTTVLGMAPLLTDAFFVAMAVVIMFGLSFATVLTLIVVPVFYAMLFRIPFKAVKHGTKSVKRTRDNRKK